MEQTTNNQRTDWIAIVIMVFVVLLLASGGNFYLNKKETAPVTTVTSTAPPNKTISIATANISITKDGFIPATIQVEKGSQVIWTNTDSSPHRIVTDPNTANIDLEALDIDPLSQGDSFIFTFEQSGNFTYHDWMNPSKFKGTIIVK